MRRLFTIVASVAILLAFFVPTALAAGPDVAARGGVIIAVEGNVDVPAGGHRDAVIVVNGTATIHGDVRAVVVAGGSATFTDATVESVLVVDGSADLGAGTIVSGDVSTIHGSVTQQPGAIVQGSTRALDTDLAAFAVLLIPLFVLLFIGFGLAAIAAALVVAAFGARQVRSVESLISGQPGQTLVAGIIGAVVLPVASILLVMTVVGAPIGLGMLLVLLPALTFLGWIVAAIWVGDWLVARMRGAREPGRPYLAAVLGVITLAIAGILPFVSGIATLFGFGALLLAAWNTLRPATPSPVTSGAAQPMPSAG
jgi:hypothetical protein